MMYDIFFLLVFLFCFFFSCLELFPNLDCKRKHQELCFSRFACLTNYYAERVDPSFFSSPLLTEKRRTEEKQFAKQQLLKISCTLGHGKHDAAPQETQSALSTPPLPSLIPNNMRWEERARTRITEMGQELEAGQESPVNLSPHEEEDLGIADYCERGSDFYEGESDSETINYHDFDNDCNERSICKKPRLRKETIWEKAQHLSNL